VRALSICPDSVMVDTGSIGTKGAVWCSLTSLSSDQNSLLSAIANRYLPPAALAPSPPASCELYAVGGVLVRAVSGQSASALAEGPEGDERVEMSAGLRRMIGDLRAGEEGERPISASLAVHAMQCLLVPKVSSIVARQPPRSRAKLSVDPTRLELLMPRKRRVLWAAVACVLSLSWLSLAAALFSAFSACDERAVGVVCRVLRGVALRPNRRLWRLLRSPDDALPLNSVSVDAGSDAPRHSPAEADRRRLGVSPHQPRRRQPATDRSPR